MSNDTRIVDLMYTRGSAGAPVYYLLRVHKFNEDRYRSERAFRVRFECTADGLAKVNTREKSLSAYHAYVYAICTRACMRATWQPRERGEKRPDCREFIIAEHEDRNKCGSRMQLDENK